MDFLFFGLTATCLFAFRRRDFKEGRRTPGKGLARMPGHPVTTFLFVAASWLVVINTIFKYPHNTAVGFGILFAGIPVYFFWSAQKRKRGQET
jgi:APA family basic amino acid/polyamine antiporter